MHREVAEVPAPVGQVRLRLVGGGDATTAYADLRGATAATWSPSTRRDAIVGRLGPDPLRPDADPTGPGRGSRAAARRSATC